MRWRGSRFAAEVLALALALGTSGCLAWHAGPLPGEPEEGLVVDGDAVTHYTSVRGARIHYVDTGLPEGTGASLPPVVFVHGFASSLDAWDTVVPALAGTRRIIALDLEGFGWSDRPEPAGDADYSVAEQARLVIALLDELGVGEAVLVGHSYGCAVVLAAALERPERVDALVLYSAFVYDEQLPPHLRWAQTGLGAPMFAAFYDERPDERMALAFHDPEVIPEALVETVEAQLARPGTQAAALAAVRGMELASWAPRYPAVSQPTLVLWGAEDRVTTLRFGERLVGDLAHAELRVFANCGHFPMLEAREASTRALVEFLAERGRGGAP